MSVGLEDLFGKEVLDLRLIVQHFKIGALQQLRPPIMQLLPDRLLHPWIAEFALSSRLPGNQLVDRIASRLLV